MEAHAARAGRIRARRPRRQDPSTPLAQAGSEHAAGLLHGHPLAGTPITCACAGDAAGGDASMLAAGALYIRMHCGAEVTESSTNKQHHLSMYAHMCVCVRVFGNESVCGTMFNACRWAAFRKRSASPAPGVPPSTDRPRPPSVASDPVHDE